MHFLEGVCIVVLGGDTREAVVEEDVRGFAVAEGSELEVSEEVLHVVLAEIVIRDVGHDKLSLFRSVERPDVLEQVDGDVVIASIAVGEGNVEECLALVAAFLKGIGEAVFCPLGLVRLQVDVAFRQCAPPSLTFVAVVPRFLDEVDGFGNLVQTTLGERHQLVDLRQLGLLLGQLHCTRLCLREHGKHFLIALLAAQTNGERNLNPEVVGPADEVFLVVFNGFGHLVGLHKGICLHQDGIAVLWIDGEREVGSLEGFGELLERDACLGQEIPGF